MPQFLRAGVIGAGVFGTYHGRQYARLPGVVLSAVYDVDRQRAAELAMPLGGRAFPDFEAFLDAVDLVSVASPATLHGQHAAAALAAGKPVYVEKPLATTNADAQRLCATARSAGVTLACGHQERVLFQVIGLFDVPEAPLALEAVRHGPPSARGLDVSAVLDLMIHDLDLALTLSPAEPASVTRLAGDRGANRAEVRFDDGFTAVFDVSRQAPARKRAMKLVYPSGEVEIDFLTRAFRNTTPFALNPDFAETPAARDTLGASIEGFLQAVRGEAPRPAVNGEEAARALSLALRIEAAL